MIKNIFFLFAVFISVSLSAQNPKVPSNLNEAMKILTDCIPDDLIQQSKKMNEKEIIELFDDWSLPFNKLFNDWTSTKEDKFETYFSKQGVKARSNMRDITAICWLRTVQQKELNIEELFIKYKRIEEKWAEEDKVRSTTDSLRGIYIPKDLEDCFRQIDGFWPDSVKKEVKKMSELEFAANCHMGFGMWMRNNWQLWGGSRLSKYFHDAGVHHPDDMSGIILKNYHRHLTGKKIDMEWMKPEKKK
ncbi:MAG: DUF6794 domain-containing protein [Bacteroidota bacterium]